MSRVRAFLRPLALGAALLLAPFVARAHNPDTSYARVTVGDQVIDGSVRGRLASLAAGLIST